MRIAIVGNYILLGIVAFLLISDNSHINPRAVLSVLYDYCQDQLELEKKYDDTGKLSWIEQSDYTRNLRHIDALVEVYQMITGRSISCQDLRQQEVAPQEPTTEKTLVNFAKHLKQCMAFYGTCVVKRNASGAG